MMSLCLSLLICLLSTRFDVLLSRFVNFFTSVLQSMYSFLYACRAILQYSEMQNRRTERGIAVCQIYISCEMSIVLIDSLLTVSVCLSWARYRFSDTIQDILQLIIVNFLRCMYLLNVRQIFTTQRYICYAVLRSTDAFVVLSVRKPNIT